MIYSRLSRMEGRNWGVNLQNQFSSFPGETFRVLKAKEESASGEYRTKRLVVKGWSRFKADSFVKSPSAALRFTPALLDSKLRIEGIGRGSDFQEEESSWGQSNGVNRCGVPVSTPPQSRLERDGAPCIWSFLRSHRFGDFLRDHQVVRAKNILSMKIDG